MCLILTNEILLGNVSYVDRATAASQQLAYINAAGNAIMKVDNTSFVPWGGIRNAVRVRLNPRRNALNSAV